MSITASYYFNINYCDREKNVRVDIVNDYDENYLVNGNIYSAITGGETLYIPYVGCVASVTADPLLEIVSFDNNVIKITVPENGSPTDLTYNFTVTWCNNTTTEAIINQDMYSGPFLLRKKNDIWSISTWKVYPCDEYGYATSVTSWHTSNRIGKIDTNEAILGECAYSVEDGAFDYPYNDNTLTAITFLNEDMTHIGSISWTEIRTINIPSGVTSIGEIYNNRYLHTVTFNEGCPNLETIDGGFAGCYNLKSIVIPSGVTQISGWSELSVGFSFSGCHNLTSVTFENDNLIKYIRGNAFSECANLTAITLPNSVERINDEAFMGCRSLTIMAFPSNLKYIGNRVFSGCTNLENANLPSGVTEIWRYAFRECYNLSSVTIPSSTVRIGVYENINGRHLSEPAFYRCPNITNIVVDSGNTVYDSRENCNALIRTQDNALLLGCINTVIPNSVEVIEGGAFEHCTGLTSIRIPSGLTKIHINMRKYPENYDGAYMGLASPFLGCHNLRYISVEEGNPVYDSRDGCDVLIETSSNTLIACAVIDGKNATIPNSVNKLTDYLFSGNTSLTSATIPSGVTNLGYGVFCDCCNLQSITFLSPTAPEIPKYGGKVEYDTFGNTNNCPIYVPSEYYGNYWHSNWPLLYRSRVVRIP